MIAFATNAIAAPWRRFQIWLRAEFIRATISGLEDDLNILRSIKGYHETAEQMIIEEIDAAKHRLHLITRKGGV